MSLLTDILAWSTKELLPWQRDALRRLFQKQEIFPDDVDDLYAMMKSAHGLPDLKNRQPAPLAQGHLPAPSQTTGTVVLKAMRDLKNVNRIAEGQRLAFSEKGMTVIYGGNGSGKSGYSRALKKACRARDASERVHPDASDPGASQKIPEAIFELSVGQEEKQLHWNRDATPPDELSTIAVFDARCARSYMDEGDVAYLPYGLDIVESLGQKVLPAILQKLTAETGSINTDVAPFADLSGDTLVGKAISSLGETTDPQKIKELASLSADESTRLLQLDKTLSESDPKTKATELCRSGQRIDAIISRIDTAIAWVDDVALAKLKTIDNETEAALIAESAAAERFRAGEPLLPGTGESLWKTLFESARRFSIDAAYIGKPFPHTASDAQCPLCQQILEQGAAQRIQRFDEFLRQDTAKIASEKRQNRQVAKTRISEALLGFGLENAISEELKQLDASIHGAVQKFEKTIESRRKWLLEAFESHVWNDAPVLDGDQRIPLKALSKRLADQASDLEKASDEVQKAKLQRERAELRARENLSRRLGPVLELIGRMRLKASLNKCKDDLKTKAISDKAKEFASQAITAALKTGLDIEFKALGIAHVKTRLQERVEKGKTKHKLVLDFPSSVKLDEILSEGEQRAIAIGSFLAELRLADHRGGIVFDDPVSSLDHHRRERVVARLVTEAKVRQVVIFTHDTVFLCELLETLEQQGVDFITHHLEYSGGRPGCVSEGLPWEHQKYKDRLDKLGKAQKLLASNWPAYPSPEDREKMAREYSHLRATIERIVQDVIFNGVVQRYRSYVNLSHLDKVVGFKKEECDEVKRLHKACSDVIDSHDPASAKNGTLPDATQLGKDIDDLKSLVATINDARKNNAPSLAVSAP